jgi:hypothetical protein
MICEGFLCCVAVFGGVEIWVVECSECFWLFWVSCMFWLIKN